MDENHVDYDETKRDLRSLVEEQKTIALDKYRMAIDSIDQLKTQLEGDEQKKAEAKSAEVREARKIIAKKFDAMLELIG